MACRHEESLWGRCVACGMTWEAQEKERAHECGCVPSGWYVVNPRRMDELKHAESVLAEIRAAMEVSA